MMFMPGIFFNHAIVTLLSSGIPYRSVEDMYSPEYAYDEDNEVSEEEDGEVTPGFVSDTINLVVNEGDTIILPCIVTRYSARFL